MTREHIRGIIKSAVEDVNSQLPENERLVFSDELCLSRQNDALDSMDRMALITFIEEKVLQETGREISIMEDERFGDESEKNPLCSVRSFLEYLEGIL